ncbi:nucleotidyltransferase domain-containing protein [Natronococcus sp.]|uniref:nucleotidyltransferase domain-containing protein n=1 Tax=Natronococcus sp. TaxID=35747 RepID=UPI003A4E2A12
MNASDGRSRVLAALEESVCSDTDIEFVVAFGSQTTGESTPASDFDIALKFTDDLSDIEELPLDVAHDAVNGELVCGDEQVFRQFKTDIEAAFSRQRDDLRQQQHDVIDRIAEGGLRG